MRFFYAGKDGGEESTVWGFWLFEIKWLGSIVLLCFEPGSRDAFHEHAFNSVSWLLSGKLKEEFITGLWTEYYPGRTPIITKRSHFHKVTSEGRSWVLSFRGPWSKTWREFLPQNGQYVTLTNGRKVA